MKRAFDLAVAGGLLAFASPVLLLVAVVVRLDSPGPALFRQDRVGRGGVRFRIHKFRTMRATAPGSPAATGAGGPAANVTAVTDPRITRVGRVLRSAKLDELPQLLDVLAGHMSLVGPRPELPRYVALWPSDARAVVLSVRPGITDPAAVVFRRESEELAAVPDPELHYVTVLLPKKVEMYVDYVKHRSFLGDVRLLVRTVTEVVTH